ncbi:hypothetical protein [Hornefia butyriciproducens]|nr:hypothetical protein [Hornefia butyriciproducens]MDY5462897.1 hypothetical protein [Hornefia butyriciproducens]
MRKIRASNIKAEILLRKHLYREGFRYRRNWK